jgi:integrase
MLAVLTNKTYQAIVTVAAHTGLRVSELRGLGWSDIDFAAGTLTVNQSYWGKAANETKTEASRGAVSMIPQVVEVLKARREKNLDTKYIFEGRHMQP